MGENHDQTGGRTRGPSREGRSKRVIFRRTVCLLVLCGTILFVPLFWKLWDVAIVHHEEYQKQATGQQTLDLSVSASRGDIYDRNGNVLAMSATVYSLILSPKDLVQDEVPQKDYIGTDGTLDEAAWNAAVKAAQDQLVQDLMTLIPGLDKERLERQVQATQYSYREIQTKVEEKEAETIRAYIVEHKTAHYLYLVSGTRRYYPYSSLAAQALGFVNAEGGAYGIEAAYDDVLQGTAGRVVTTRTGAGTQMYNNYSEFVDAIDGYDLTLTIDATIQSYAEKTLEKGTKAYDVRDGAFCIVMNPKTGAILAMASSPDFDPNNYSAITNDQLNQDMAKSISAIYEKMKNDNPQGLTDAELMDQAQAEAYSTAVNTQWRSKALDSRYEPGSTFKAV
ncbi:MAG: penicillin-binding transpeptidase domain-containing protein, partial [Lawsonibacter sp.]|nr:penicillin-binding transpeptidase domain-containing protein [Lawsonibacter sp.]